MPAIRCLFATLLVAIVVAPAQAQRKSRAAGVPHTFTLTFKLTSAGTSRNVKLKVAVPQSIDGWQTIEKIRYSRQPASVKTKGDGRYAEFVFDQLRKTETLTITIDAKLQQPDWTTLSRRRKRKLPAPDKSFTQPEKYIESDDATIKSIAAKIPGRTRLARVQGIMRYVANRLRKVSYDPKDHGAAWALKGGKGDCTEYADLFVALCRAKGIPARCVEGFLNYIPRNDTAKHNWAEVFFDGVGWVAFDPLHVDLRIAAPLKLKAHYLRLTGKRYDSELDGYHFFSYRYSNDKVTVRDSFAVKKGR